MVFPAAFGPVINVLFFKSYEFLITVSPSIDAKWACLNEVCFFEILHLLIVPDLISFLIPIIWSKYSFYPKI